MDTKQVVICGGGFGGVYVYKHLHRLLHDNAAVELTLVNKTNYFLFTPLLHEVATGGVSTDHVVEPLRKILGCCLNRFYHAEVQKISLKKKQVITTQGTIPYDTLVLALGAQTNFFDVPGAEQYAFPLKSLSDAAALRNHCIDLFERASKCSNEKQVRDLLRFIVVGGGATGVELAAEMEEFFCETFGKFFHEDNLVSRVEIILLQRARSLVPQFSDFFQKKTLTLLRKEGVIVRLETAVKKVTEKSVVLESGEEIVAHTVVWVAGIKPVSCSFDMPVQRDTQGRLMVNAYVQLEGYSDAFALGDGSCFVDTRTKTPLPPLAQVATRQAECVAENIFRIIRKKPLKAFSYTHEGDLLSLGQWMAIAEIGRFRFFGHFAWWLWRTVYLSKIISWHKKIKVVGDWTINLFGPRDISQL